MDDFKNPENQAPQNNEAPDGDVGATNEENVAEIPKFQEVEPQSDDGAVAENKVEPQDASSPSSEKIDAQVPVVASEIAPDSTDYLQSIDERFNNVAKTEERLLSEVRELHKLYHNEFAGRLKSMQDELDRYRNAESGRAFDGILSEIARIYNTYETLPDGVQEAKIKKGIVYLLEDLRELVGEYGMTAYRSEPLSKRSPRFCKIADRLPTDAPEKHDVVAKSYNTGFRIDNRVVVEERVDVYVYVPTDTLTEEAKPNAEEASNETC